MTDREDNGTKEGNVPENDSEDIKADSLIELARKLEFGDRETLGGQSDSESFKPAEAVWVIDAFFSKNYSRTVGAIVGIIYSNFTILLFLTVWLSFFYLLTFSDSNELSGASWAAFSVTMGSFVLISGANLVDHYDEDDLNFTAYIHNSITFIGSGIFLSVGYILDSYFDVRLELSLDLLPTLVLIGNNLLGTLFFALSIWVLLKILWRLNQLIYWKSEYTDKSPYSELRATLVGFYMGLTAGGEAGLTSAILSLGITVGAAIIPYLITSNIFWSAVGFASVIGLNILIGIASFCIRYFKSSGESSE